VVRAGDLLIIVNGVENSPHLAPIFVIDVRAAQEGFYVSPLGLTEFAPPWFNPPPDLLDLDFVSLHKPVCLAIMVLSEITAPIEPGEMGLSCGSDSRIGGTLTDLYDVGGELVRSVEDAGTLGALGHSHAIPQARPDPIGRRRLDGVYDDHP
jgi:hypothetical protein